MSTSAEKQKIKLEQVIPTGECADHLAAIVSGLRAGRVTFQQGDEALSMASPANIDVEVKARRKGKACSISIELGWEEAPLDEPLMLTSEGGHRSTWQTSPPVADAVATQAAADTVATQAAAGESDPVEAVAVPPTLGTAETRAWLAECSRDELYEKAQALEVAGRSQMSKEELVEALATTYPASELFTRDQVYARAQAAEVPGRSQMSKQALLEAL